MKATGLRWMTGFVAGAALVVGAAVASPTASADGSALKSAFEDYAAGKLEDALKKLQEYVASNPGDDEVYAVLRDVDEQVKLRALSAGGDHEKLVRYLLDKARPVVEARKRDPDAIKALVEQALTGEIDARKKAGWELAAKNGDYAVPYLLPALGDNDPAKVVNAIFALHYIGSEAVLPLTQAMASDDARLRGYVAVVLGDIRDPRALPALRRAVEKDTDDGVKAKAAASIQKIRPDGASMSAADSYVRFGERYLANDPSVLAELDQVHNLWKWEGGLARYEVPASMLGALLAEQSASDALKLDASSRGARSLLVRALLAQQAEGAAMGEKAPEALKAAGDLLASLGFDAASAALADALDRSQWDLAVGAAQLVASTYGGQSLAGHPLGRALAAPEKRVQYAAAVAALRMSPAGAFENSAQVPALAAQAASEQALRQVFVIDDQDASRARLAQDLREAGYIVTDDRDGHRGVTRLKGAPATDVVVVRADLDAANTIPMQRWQGTLAVIDEILADIRTKNMRVMVVGGAAGKEMLTAKYGDKLAGFIEEPLVATAYLPNVQAAVEKGDMNAERAAALAVAADASDALATTNPCCTAWDFKVVIDPLANNVAEGASDLIKMNAVRALGNLKAGGSAALAGVLKSGDAKEELKVAAATALGQVLSRMDGSADDVDALVAAAKAGGAVGSAAMKALGMVRNMPADVARGVYADHPLGVGTKGE
ncbi:MAG: HEAT repeat domain-containing protein [Planctomycetia bacterium]|nr:HEAT repeat domain-containing protein [Planctomycetia bacterium]